MAAAQKLEECLECPVDIKLCLRAALDGCQKRFDWLWPARKGRAGPGEGEEPVLVPRDGGGA